MTGTPPLSSVLPRADRLSCARQDFPAGFIFGAASSATQIEGSGFGGAGLSHWDTFAATPGNVAHNEDARIACDHYHRWPADLDLVRDAGFDAYRFSTSWARVQPEGTGPANREGLDFYDRLVDGMLERGIRPHLTLYHWDLPAALALKGGWANRDIAGWFTDYARLAMNRLGDRIAATATINEPWCVAWLSHFLGAHAPGLRDIHAAAHAMHNVLFAHGTALGALRADGHRNLGLVLNFEHIAPAHDIPADRDAAAREDAIFNRWFVDAVAQGGYPAAALDGIAAHLPPSWQADMDTIATPLDWLGVNYYRRALKAAAPDMLWPGARDVAGPLPKTTMGWEVYPEGLAARIAQLTASFGAALPILVTENGMSWNDSPGPGSIDDAERIAYVDAHLQAVRTAIAAGANVRGYFYWSLLDNYEWALGYEKRFGLVHVDFNSLKRTPKRSYHAFKDMLARAGR